ncbi:MAG: hypothetical protein Kow00109_17370 [Acidobacteriota bacterium]
MTIRLDDIRQGRIELEKEGEKVTIDSSEGAEGGMTITTGEGTVQMGGHAADRPDWVPVYPGTEVQNLLSQVKEGKRSGMLGQETPEDLETVMEEFRLRLEEQGFEVEESKVEIQGELLQLHLDATDQQGRKVSVVASRKDEGGTSLMIQYEEPE